MAKTVSKVLGVVYVVVGVAGLVVGEDADRPAGWRHLHNTGRFTEPGTSDGSCQAPCDLSSAISRSSASA